ncbi:MAG: hypothetical protein IT292_02805 [Deltaproteobacteria bacterium]|nr:hypothetical protein [Deltaproteobacteria bacterium]
MAYSIVIICALIIIAVLIAMIGIAYRNSYRKDVLSMVRELEAYSTETYNRLNSVRPYVLDYFNTLHAEGEESYEVLNVIISCLEERVKSVSELLASGSYADVKRAAMLIGEDLDLDEYTERTGIVVKSKIARRLPAENWEKVIEELFQAIGKKLAKASISSSTYRHVPRKRTSTLNALIDAGIKGITGKKPNS